MRPVVVGHGRQQAEQRDPPAGERVGAVGHRLGDEQAGPRVADRVLGVLGHEADEEQRVARDRRGRSWPPSRTGSPAGSAAMRRERAPVPDATSVRHRSACDGSGGGGPPGWAVAPAPPSSPTGTWCPVGRRCHPATLRAEPWPRRPAHTPRAARPPRPKTCRGRRRSSPGRPGRPVCPLALGNAEGESTLPTWSSMCSAIGCTGAVVNSATGQRSGCRRGRWCAGPCRRCPTRRWRLRRW